MTALCGIGNKLTIYTNRPQEVLSLNLYILKNYEVILPNWLISLTCFYVLGVQEVLFLKI